jgi:hypothetical protein
MIFDVNFVLSLFNSLHFLLFIIRWHLYLRIKRVSRDFVLLGHQLYRLSGLDLFGGAL